MDTTADFLLDAGRAVMKIIPVILVGGLCAALGVLWVIGAAMPAQPPQPKKPPIEVKISDIEYLDSGWVWLLFTVENNTGNFYRAIQFDCAFYQDHKPVHADGFIVEQAPSYHTTVLRTSMHLGLTKNPNTYNCRVTSTVRRGDTYGRCVTGSLRHFTTSFCCGAPATGG
jgi:hypothetical protein